MVTYIAIVGTILAVLALAAYPVAGVSLTLLVRPIIDATWADKFVGGFGLTEMIGVAMPIAVLAFALTRARGAQRFSRIPLLSIWAIYAADVLLSSLIILSNEGVESGASIFFRQINGLAAYYIGQASFRDEKSIAVFFRVLVAATLFPVGIGLYQFATGYQWLHADTEGITRYIGLYHDAFTVRYYMLQGILAAVVLLALRKGRLNAEKILLGVFIACALLVMFRAYSKSAIAAIALWTLLWCVLRRKFLLLAAFAVAGLVLAGVYFPEISGQVGQMFNKEVGALQGHVDMSRTFAGRWYGWHDMLAHWGELPALAKMFGSGATAVGAHNDYLMMLIQGGVVGVALYLLLLGTVGARLVRNAMAQPDPIALAGLLAIALWGIDSIGLVPSSYPGYQWFVWAVIGISLRTRADERRSHYVLQTVAA